MIFAALVAVGFFAGGALLAADAWQRAWRPPLWTAFEQMARVQRAQAEADGRRLPEDDEAFAVVEGVLRSDASLGASGASLSIDVDAMAEQDGREGRQRQERPNGRDAGSATAVAEGISGGVAVTVVGSLAAERLGDWRAGRRVRVPVTLRRPSRYLDPGVPDHERDLARRGTRLVGTVKSGALVELLARGGWFAEAMAASRSVARRAIADGVGRWSTRSGAIVAAIVLGDRAGLDEEVQQRLQEAGTYHVIAISGGNIAILAGLLLGAFRLAGWLGRTAMLSSIAVLLAYATLVGHGASVDRATLMAVVYFGARAADLRSPPLNALALVAAMLVAADPLSVAEPAFVLTFGATLAILTIVPAITKTAAAESAEAAKQKQYISAPSAISALASFLRPMFFASVAAEALLFPVGALTFSRVTFAGLALNFLAIPMMGVAQIAGMAVVPLALVSRTLAAGAGWIAHVGAAGLVWSAELVRFAPALTYRVAPPPSIAVCLYYAAAAVCWLCTTGDARSRLAWPHRRAITRWGAGLAVAAAIWILADPRTLAASRGDGRLHVTFLDVGQGDSAFVVFPHGSTLLVDAGGLSASSSFDIGDRVVAPVLRGAGFRRIDYVALTHGDPDHIGGAASIVREFRPREVWEGIPVPRSDPLTRLRVAVQAGGARWANVYRGDRVAVDEVDVIARHPAPADWERQKVRNDDSLVLELRWRDVSVVLTGDIGRAVEPSVASAIPPARLRVVKIPHHASLTSSTPAFVAALRPQVAIASAGRANHFGHPVPEILDRYRSIGAEIFRTDQDGAVTLTTDGASIEVHTFTGRTTFVP
ncbi:MAG: ComEC family competence protein [Acidobacteria bacterium]|nr:ComEC family competence protein [Acidobacteriota bacterium]